MVDPSLLLDKIQEALANSPGVQELLGFVGNIVIHEDKILLSEALNEVDVRSILIVWDGLDASDDLSPFVHSVTLYVRSQCAMHKAFWKIMSAVPGGSQFPVNLGVFHEDFELIGAPSASRETDEDGVDRMKISMRFKDRSQT